MSNARDVLGGSDMYSVTLKYWSPYQLNILWEGLAAAKNINMLCCRQKKRRRKYPPGVSIRQREQEVSSVSVALCVRLRDKGISDKYAGKQTQFIG